MTRWSKKPLKREKHLLHWLAKFKHVPFPASLSNGLWNPSCRFSKSQILYSKLSCCTLPDSISFHTCPHIATASSSRGPTSDACGSAGMSSMPGAVGCPKICSRWYLKSSWSLTFNLNTCTPRSSKNWSRRVRTARSNRESWRSRGSSSKFRWDPSHWGSTRLSSGPIWWRWFTRMDGRNSWTVWAHCFWKSVRSKRLGLKHVRPCWRATEAMLSNSAVISDDSKSAWMKARAKREPATGCICPKYLKACLAMLTKGTSSWTPASTIANAVHPRWGNPKEETVAAHRTPNALNKSTLLTGSLE